MWEDPDYGWLPDSAGRNSGSLESLISAPLILSIPNLLCSDSIYNDSRQLECIRVAHTVRFAVNKGTRNTFLVRFLKLSIAAMSGADAKVLKLNKTIKGHQKHRNLCKDKCMSS